MVVYQTYSTQPIHAFPPANEHGPTQVFLGTAFMQSTGTVVRAGILHQPPGIVHPPAAGVAGDIQMQPNLVAAPPPQNGYPSVGNVISIQPMQVQHRANSKQTYNVIDPKAVLKSTPGDGEV